MLLTQVSMFMLIQSTLNNTKPTGTTKNCELTELSIKQESTLPVARNTFPFLIY